MIIDWAQLCLNLRKYSGMPLREWSLKLGLEHGHLGRLSRNEAAEPRFSLAMQLLDLHLDICGEDVHKRLIR